MTHKCIELIKTFEGFSPTVYICPAGYPTIGYGHVVWNWDGKQMKITEEEAERLLIEDLVKLEKNVKQLITVNMHEYMLDAILSFTYNVGIYAFRASTLRRKLNRGEFFDAAEEFLKWVFAGGKRLLGLVRRRQVERALFLKGVELIGRY